MLICLGSHTIAQTASVEQKREEGRLHPKARHTPITHKQSDEAMVDINADQPHPGSLILFCTGRTSYLELYQWDSANPTMGDQLKQKRNWNHK